MTNNRHDALCELPIDAGGEPFEHRELRRRTDFQSRASRAGADFKTMALSRLREAGAEIERSNFEIDGFPVDALVHGSNGRRFLVLARGTPAEQKASGPTDAEPPSAPWRLREERPQRALFNEALEPEVE